MEYIIDIWAGCMLTLQGTDKLLEINISFKILLSLRIFFRSEKHMGLIVQMAPDFWKLYNFTMRMWQDNKLKGSAFNNFLQNKDYVVCISPHGFSICDRFSALHVLPANSLHAENI